MRPGDEVAMEVLEAMRRRANRRIVDATGLTIAMSIETALADAGR